MALLAAAARGRRGARGDGRGAPDGREQADGEPAPADAAAWLARRSAERRARALAELGELRWRLSEAAARCDAYLQGESADIGAPQPAWRPYAAAGAVALSEDREAYVVVAAACRGMETVADAPAPERVEPVRRMIGRALRALDRVLE